MQPPRSELRPLQLMPLTHRQKHLLILLRLFVGVLAVFAVWSFVANLR